MDVTLRRVCLDDEEMLFQWRLADEHRSPWWAGVHVTRERHAKWFRDRLDSPAVRMFVLELDGIPVGDGRIESTGEIVYNVTPEHQGRGFGTELVRMLVADARRDGWTRIRALVDEDNGASARVLQKAGFSRRPDVEFWRLDA